MLPEHQQAPFVLTAITLRGIGSYLRGARLEIRPLTILCGKNGSGKSTWLKALNLLTRSLEANRLPFGFDDASPGLRDRELRAKTEADLADYVAELADFVADLSDVDISGSELAKEAANMIKFMQRRLIKTAQMQGREALNAFYYGADPVDHARVADPEATRLYGPPGTIGLEFTAIREVTLGGENDNVHAVSGAAQRFLWSGQCAAGTRFRVRLAHPNYWDQWRNDTATPELFDVVELCLDRQFTISMTGDRDPNQTFEDGNSRPTRSKPYELSCSVAFLRGSDGADARVVQLATVTDLVRLHCASLSRLAPPSVAAEVVEHLEKRLQQLLDIVLSGYFYIGPQRPPYTSESISVGLDEPSCLERRHVGAAGEHAWSVERHFATNLMREGAASEAFQPDEFTGGVYCLFPFDGLHAIGANLTVPAARIDRIWQLAADEPKKDAQRLLAEFKEVQNALTLAAGTGGAAEDAASKAYYDWCDSHFDDIAECVASLLNSVLDRRDLFAPCLHHVGIEQAYYGQGRINSLNRSELAIVNRLLIESELQIESERQGHDAGSSFGWRWYSFEAYVSRWMRKLTEVRIGHRASQGRLFSADSSMDEAEQSYQPRGFLFEADFWDEPTTPYELRVDSLLHPCFGAPLPAPQSPRQMSSGFHQVFPIVVQLGLMRQGEVVGIENPEVHLHPSLQLKISEALVAHATTGRRILVETHSDLVIRRVIRAILQEELKQAEVQIYFTALEGKETARCQGAETTFWYSVLDPIAVDGRGRISNWPDGFLGDDVRESQRLLDIMYGGTDSGGDDDE